MVGIIIRFVGGCVISVLEGIELGCFIGSFDGTGYEVVGPCEVIVVGGIITAYEIYDIQLNDSSPVSYKVATMS